MSEPDAVLVERDGPVTIVSINRPHCRNAVDGLTARKVYDTFLAFDADNDASVAVFTGQRSVPHVVATRLSMLRPTASCRK